MRRRAFIEGVAAFGVAWPLAARAQQSSVPSRLGNQVIAAPDKLNSKHMGSGNADLRRFVTRLF
jgi:hypothetical protein